MKKGFFGSMRKGFKLGSKPKLQGRFVRSKFNANKNVKFAKRFFKKTNKEKRTYFKRKSLIMRRKAAEKALETGQAVKTKFKKSITSKGFNPIKFITAIFVGWIVNQLPKIISTLKEWMKKLKPIFDTLKSWVTGVLDFFKMIGNGVGKFLSAITGDNNTVDAEKKKLEDANKNLKGTFKKTNDGFNELEQKAKGEEKKLKKDMDNLDKEVNNELNGKGSDSVSGNVKVNPITVLEDNKDIIPPGMSGVVENEVKNNPSKYDTKEEINAALSNVGVDPSKVKYRSSYSNQSSTVTGTIRHKSITSNPKNGNVNLKVDSKNKNKVVTVDIPYTSPKNRGGQGGGSRTTTVKQDNSDSVNSNELLLISIEK